MLLLLFPFLRRLGSGFSLETPDDVHSNSSATHVNESHYSTIYMSFIVPMKGLHFNASGKYASITNH